MSALSGHHIFQHFGFGLYRLQSREKSVSAVNVIQALVFGQWQPELRQDG